MTGKESRTSQEEEREKMSNNQNNFPGSKPLNNVRDISDYLYCARKVYLRKTLNLREKTNAKMVKGMIRHEIFDEFNKTEEEIVSGITQQKNLTELGDIYKKYLLEIADWSFRKNENFTNEFGINKQEFWQDFWKNVQQEIQLRIKAIYKLLKKNILGVELWKKLEPKYLTEFKVVSDRLQLVGRIDRVIIEKQDGRTIYVPCEIKNADTIKPYESDMLQLACYAMLLEDKFGTEIKKGIIQYKNRKIDVEIDEGKRQKVFDIIKSIGNFSSAAMPKILENFNKCRACGLREECFGAQKTR